MSGRRIKRARVAQGKGVRRGVVHAGKLTPTGARGLSTHVTQSRRRR